MYIVLRVEPCGRTCASVGLFSTVNHPSLCMSDSYRESGFKKCGAFLWSVISQWEFRKYGASISRSCQVPVLNLTNRIYQRANAEEHYAHVKGMPVVEEVFRSFNLVKVALLYCKKSTEVLATKVLTVQNCPCQCYYYITVLFIL